MHDYCSLADGRYLPQLLALYDSLEKQSSEPFLLFVLPLDGDCHRALVRLALPSVRILPFDSFVHDMKLAGIQNSRTHQEWCWTLASQMCEYLMSSGFYEVTYLDADLMFFSDPKAIFDEIDGASIAVIPHRLTDNDQRERLEKNGKFNVSWVTFKSNPGRDCAARWAAQVRERCSAAVGCGDQLYLDEWEHRYGPFLRIIENIGAGLAPWNLQTYGLYQFESGPPQLAPACNYGFAGFAPVVFYHYHEMRFDEYDSIRLTNYPLRIEDVEILYKPYIAAVKAAKERLASVHLSA